MISITMGNKDTLLASYRKMKSPIQSDNRQNIIKWASLTNARFKRKHTELIQSQQQYTKKRIEKRNLW